MEKRFLRVAPDSESLERNDNDSEVAQIRIISDIHRRPRLVPSLLHACHYSRKEAIKGYELWGCADPVTYEANSAKVYVKVDIDSFFFGDADLVSNNEASAHGSSPRLSRILFVLHTRANTDRVISGPSTPSSMRVSPMTPRPTTLPEPSSLSRLD